MAGNARFHDKLHRKNHHTLSSYGFPDSAMDPIASHTEPFQGDFVINGSLSTSAGLHFLSADFDGDLYCENLHVRDSTYTNFISGQGTETIISDGALTGYGVYTLTMDYRTAIYAKTPVFNISNTISALGNIYSPTINTINTKLSALSASISTLSNGFSASLLSGGYQFLPSGLIMQWGFYSNISITANSWYTVTFPKRFTTSCFNVNITNHDPISADNHASVLIKAPSVSSVDVSWSTTKPHAIYWQAIGY